MRPVPGAAATGVIVGAVIGHEVMALRYDPEQLITRVIARWRRHHRVLVNVLIVYFAGHLMDVWPYDPLSVR